MSNGITRSSVRRGVWPALVALALTIGSAGSTVLGIGQQPADTVWQLANGPMPAAAAAARVAAGQAVVRFDKTAFDALMSAAPAESAMRSAGELVFSLPLSDGTFQRFRVADSPMLAPELAAAFPEIRTFTGQGIDDPTATTRFGWTSAGFHAIVVAASGTVYVDPVEPSDIEFYVAAGKASRQQPDAPFICLLDGANHPLEAQRAVGVFPISHGTSLRTYRMAMAATAEYTVAAGGTKALAFARIVTTMNRVNGIYEREVAVRMTVATGTGADPTALIYLA